MPGTYIWSCVHGQTIVMWPQQKHEKYMGNGGNARTMGESYARHIVYEKLFV